MHALCASGARRPRSQPHSPVGPGRARGCSVGGWGGWGSCSGAAEGGGRRATAAPCCTVALICSNCSREIVPKRSASSCASSAFSSRQRQEDRHHRGAVPHGRDAVRRERQLYVREGGKVGITSKGRTQSYAGIHDKTLINHKSRFFFERTRLVPGSADSGNSAF